MEGEGGFLSKERRCWTCGRREDSMRSWMAHTTVVSARSETKSGKRQLLTELP